MSVGSMEAVSVSVKRHSGIAGQVAYTASVQWEDGNRTEYTFHGSLYGTPGPVFIDWYGTQLYVDAPERFGDAFDVQWVRRFYEMGDD